MTIVLPIKPAGLPALEARLDKELATWLHLIDATTPSSVDLFLPRIQMDAGYDLVPALKNMGMGIAFTNKADFKGIADTGLNISGVIHKTFLKMDEKGTEAAASTAVIVAMTAAPAMPTPVFRADRPFLLMIRDKTSGAILFLGRMSDPSEK